MSVAIVTGGSRGFGRALTAGLAAAGWQVVIDGRDAAGLARAAHDIGTDRVTAVPGDVTDPEHRAALLAAADRLGGPDLLVHNAGILGPSPLPPLADQPLPAVRELFEINVVAPLALTQLALPALRRRAGAVVLVGSDAATEAYPGWGGYGATKAAAEQCGHILAVEEPAVRVWVVDPGDMRTGMYQAAFPGEDISDRPLPETVVPALLGIVAGRPASGRFRLAELAESSPA